MQPTHASRRILLPVRNWFIVLTLFLALVLNLVPFGRFPGIPDWVALVLAFWCVHQPLKVGMAAGFVLGLAMDVADASVMGQHALAYVLLAFAAAGWSRRVLWFPLSQQALHVLPMFLGMQLSKPVAPASGRGAQRGIRGALLRARGAGRPRRAIRGTGGGGRSICFCVACR